MNPVMPVYMPRFAARSQMGGFDAVFGDQGQQLYERIMIGSGRIEITHAGASVLRGFLKENPEKHAELYARMRELGIPQPRINVVFEPEKPSGMGEPDVRKAMAVFADDPEFARAMQAGKPTNRDLGGAYRRLLQQAHSDAGGSDNGDRIIALQKAREKVKHLLPDA